MQSYQLSSGQSPCILQAEALKLTAQGNKDKIARQTLQMLSSLWQAAGANNWQLRSSRGQKT